MRRRSIEIVENHDRWIISYADFITLLFAFFVVMYAISSVNEGKYRILSETLEAAFSVEPKSPDLITEPEEQYSPGFADQPYTIMPIPSAYRRPRDSQPNPDLAQIPRLSDSTHQGILNGGVDQLVQLAGEIRNQFSELIEDRMLTVKQSDNWIEVQINNSILFGSGEAKPSFAAKGILDQLAKLLMGTENPVQVEGHTDNVPISNFRFPSNWELSAARASSIVRLITIDALEPERLVAVGYGEYQPIASNNNPAGRRENRRVAIIISRAGLNGKSIRTPTQRAAELEAYQAAKVEQFGSKVLTRPKPSLPTSLVEPVTPRKLEGGGLIFTADPEPASEF